VQGILEAALETVLRLPVGSCRLTVAGRTDAGVHATGNVVSLRAPRLRPVRAVNRRLPPDVALLSCERADDDFDARGHARSRTYTYRIATGDRPDPFRARYELYRPRRESLAQSQRGAHATTWTDPGAGPHRR